MFPRIDSKRKEINSLILSFKALMITKSFYPHERISNAYGKEFLMSITQPFPHSLSCMSNTQLKDGATVAFCENNFCCNLKTTEVYKSIHL